MSQQFLSSFRRHLSTTIAAKLSASSAKNRLRKTFDPDKALSIFASSTPSTSRSIRSALDLTVRRLAQARRFSEIDHLIQSHRNSHPTPHDEPFLSSLIISYGSANMLTNARLLFDELSNPTVVAFNAMLTACNRVKKPSLVSKLFDELRSKHSSISPNEVSYGILIKSKCMSGKVDKAVEVFKEMKEKDFKLSSIVYSTIIDGLYSKRKVEEAENVSCSSTMADISSNQCTYTTPAELNNEEAIPMINNNPDNTSRHLQPLVAGKQMKSLCAQVHQHFKEPIILE